MVEQLLKMCETKCNRLQTKAKKKQQENRFDLQINAGIRQVLFFYYTILKCE